MEFNPALVKRFISTQTLRRTKTDKKDAMPITKYLISVDYKPHLKQFYHKLVLCQVLGHVSTKKCEK